MTGSASRPWGTLHWVLGKLPVGRWSLIGSISPELRSFTAWWELNKSEGLANSQFIKIDDEPSRYSEITKDIVSRQIETFVRLGGQQETVVSLNLFERHENIVRTVSNFLDQSGENVIIDISTFPKRYFFPIVKLVLRSSSVRNIIACYSVPRHYAGEALAEDPEPYQALPLFASPDPEPEQKVLIIGAGYEVLGLPQLIDDFKGTDVELLFPFPATALGFPKNWEFIRQLEPNVGKAVYKPIRVGTHNVSAMFEQICSLTNHGERYAVFAPYGPKTMSLAMCLYAVSPLTSHSPPAVYYTQPKVYNPNYSKGIKKDRGEKVVFSYCLRINGVDLY